MIRFDPHILKIIANDDTGLRRGDLCFDLQRGVYFAPGAVAAVVYAGRLALIKPSAGAR